MLKYIESKNVCEGIRISTTFRFLIISCFVKKIHSFWNLFTILRVRFEKSEISCLIFFVFWSDC